MDRESVDDFLRTADAVLNDDWTVSDDAMRWIPEEQREAPLELTPIASRMPQARRNLIWSYPRPTFSIDSAALEAALQRFGDIMFHLSESERVFLNAVAEGAEQGRQLAERLRAMRIAVEPTPRTAREREYTRVFREGIERVQRDEAFMDIMRLNEEMRSYADLMPAVPVVEMPEPRTRPGDDITDPRERALYLRRNRNTGPQPTRRAPRTIDPHGHR